MESMVYYALEHGFPRDPTRSWTMCGCRRRGAVVDFVNVADLDTLDHEAGLDRRAVDGIAGARPISTAISPLFPMWVQPPGGSARRDRLASSTDWLARHPSAIRRRG